MGLKLFGKTDAPTLAFGAAMLALVGTSASAEQVDAANQELDAAGIKGAQLVPGAVLTDLTEKAERTEAAEKTAIEQTAKADKAATDLATEKGRADKATTDLEAANKELATLRKAPGASHTTPTLPAGTSDVEQTALDENQQAIDELPHNKAIAGNPLFGPRIKD